MLTNKPGFPAFDEWARMSEQEQDAVLARMESARRRKGWLLLGACGAGLFALAWSFFQYLFS
jgi:hypothetical protein